MPDSLEIVPLDGSIDANVAVPGSKSITNRALLVAALAEGRSQLTGALFSDDTRYMAESLEHLGVDIEGDESSSTFQVEGRAGRIPVDSAELYIGNSGTTSRSLISYVALGNGTFVIDGDEPMRRSRPISELLNALNRLGVDARSKHDNGCLPVVVNAAGYKGGKTAVDASKSSQFLTSLMLTAPYAEEGLEIQVLGELKTQYIDITMAVMKSFGVSLEHEDYRHFKIEGGQSYKARSYAVEADASNASYFFAAAALCGGRVRVTNIPFSSMQGDIHFLDVLEKMGCVVKRNKESVEVFGPAQLQGIDVDMKEISDTALTLAAIAPFAQSRVNIQNIEHTRWQETDRVSALATELKKLGVDVAERRDGLMIMPSPVRPAAVDTYSDHRMAMSFSLIGLRMPGIRINDPGCVAKTFPRFFEALETLRRT